MRTSASLEAGDVTVVSNDLDAEARFGATAPVECETVGAVEGPTDEHLNPGDTAAQLLRYVLGAWSDPVTLHTLAVGASRFARAVYLGDVVQFDAFNAPDGAGDYGLEGARGVVYSKEESFEGEDALTLGVLVFEAAERIAAIAPSARVASVSGATLTLATAYLTWSAEDYAGSDLPGYRFASDAANDGGASWFAPGMVLRLETLDAATLTAQDALVVAGVDPAAKTITLTATVGTGILDWVAYLTGGGNVDVVFDHYAATGEAEHDFAHVASETANTLDGTADAPNRWAP